MPFSGSAVRSLALSPSEECLVPKQKSMGFVVGNGSFLFCEGSFPYIQVWEVGDLVDLVHVVCPGCVLVFKRRTEKSNTSNQH